MSQGGHLLSALFNQSTPICLKVRGGGGGGGGRWVAHVILVSVQVLLVLTLGLWTRDQGLTIIPLSDS